MADSNVQYPSWAKSDAEVFELRRKVSDMTQYIEELQTRIQFWIDQTAAAKRQKADLYSLLMSLRVQIDQAFGDQPEEATQK